MNKQKRLTWKYFIQQKREEIMENIIGLIGWSFMMALFFIVFGLAMYSEGYEYFIWLSNIGITIITFWFTIGFIYISKIFIDWISSNWKEAKNRAKKELRRKQNE